MKHLIPLAALAAFATSALAQTVYVNYGGNYVSGNVAFTNTLPTSPVATGALGATATQDVYTIVPLSLTTARIASSGSYSGPSIYGGSQAIRYDSFGTSSSNGNTERIHDNAGADLIRAQFVSANSTPSQYVMVNLFRKADFLNGGSGQTVQFGSGSTLSLGVNAFNSNIAGSTVRFVVQSGGSYYVSNATAALTNGAASSFSLSGAALTNALWTAYTPTATDLRLPTSLGGVTTSALNDITAVGFAWDLPSSAGQTTYNITFDSFQVSAIPEPSTYAALAGVAALGLAFWRRRR